MRDATDAERTERGVVHTYTVHYPSGAVFAVTGVLLCTVETVAVRQADSDRAFVLDPRAVLVRDDLIIYEPRRGRQQPWVRDWLRAHPEWPRLVTEATP